MKFHIETDRLILREFRLDDAEAMLAMDSDPEVHRYLGNNTIDDIEAIRKTIEHVQLQYEKNGIGRWAIVEKETKAFVGWTGLKYETLLIDNKTRYYDLGYRILRKYWGKGFATESALASLEYGFNEMQLHEIGAIADCKNKASNHILQKVGLQQVKQFDVGTGPHYLYNISKTDWEAR